VTADSKDSDSVATRQKIKLCCCCESR